MPKSLKDQTPQELGGQSSALARQRRDHAEIDRLMELYRRSAGQEREQALKNLVQLVFSHAFAEETVLWPAVRRSVPSGEELTVRVEEEHQQINDLVADIERLPPGDPEREDKVERAFVLIRQDIQRRGGPPAPTAAGRGGHGPTTAPGLRAAEPLRPHAGRAWTHELEPGRQRGVRPVMPRAVSRFTHASARSASEMTGLDKGHHDRLVTMDDVLSFVGPTPA
ncbi:hemerythrin domain-containing protein [Streptomyces sp. NPDC058676]|uniref:hemerythrin domain-containing protein n=1 Tax=unclassified Streptomyces TaxID=2593676 RepID=UPI00364DE995